MRHNREYTASNRKKKKKKMKTIHNSLEKCIRILTYTC